MATSVIQTLKEAKPSLLNEFDAVVIALHSVMRELGFRCVGLAEKKTETNDNTEQPIPVGWNQSSGDAYSFQYKHTQSAMTFILKAIVMNDKLLVHGIAKEDNKLQSLELSVKDYIKEKSALDNYDNLFKDLDKLIALFKINITSKLLPMLNKPGYEAGDSTTTTRTTTNPNNQPQRDEPLYEPYRDPTLVHDPLRIPGSGRGPMPVPGGFGVGYGDRFGPAFPGMGYDPGAMGNLIGPNHPGFGGMRGPDPNVGLPIGGPRLPRGAVPPGARFDPFGPPPPGALNPNNPNFRNQFGPDNDDLPPPGYDNMYL